MMHIGPMPVRVSCRHMAVKMGMRFTGGIMWAMTLLKVLIMAVPMIMFQISVRVLMRMAL